MSKLAHSSKKHMLKIERDRIKRTAPKCDTDPDFDGACEVCGQSPIIPLTGLCGPCTFGNADTANGTW